LPIVSAAGVSRIAVAKGDISCAVEGPEDAVATVVLAHGAGADMRSDFMTVVAGGLAGQGLRVVRFNFPYAEQGRRSPDKQDVLEATWSEVLAALEAGDRERPLVLGGKSLGGRIASHVVAGGASADGLVFLGYPLHAPGRPDRMRDAHLAHISVPMLFVEGTRDPFCPLPTLQRVVEGLDADVQIVTVEDGDHSFRVRRSSGRTTRGAWADIPPAVASWVHALARA
jgi:predicted alpha/beta-hydrolase family hydrolase